MQDPNVTEAARRLIDAIDNSADVEISNEVYNARNVLADAIAGKRVAPTVFVQRKRWPAFVIGFVLALAVSRAFWFLTVCGSGS